MTVDAEHHIENQENIVGHGARTSSEKVTGVLQPNNSDPSLESSERLFQCES